MRIKRSSKPGAWLGASFGYMLGPGVLLAVGQAASHPQSQGHVGPWHCNKQLIEMMEKSKPDEMECHRAKRGCAQTWRRSRWERRLRFSPGFQENWSLERVWPRSCAPGPCARRTALSGSAVRWPPACGPRPLSSPRKGGPHRHAEDSGPLCRLTLVRDP